MVDEDEDEPRRAPILVPDAAGILANVAAINRLWPGDPLMCLLQHLLHYHELVTKLDPDDTVDDTPLHELIAGLADRHAGRTSPAWLEPAPRTRADGRPAAGRPEADTATIERRLAAAAAVDRLDALTRNVRHAAALVGEALGVPAGTVRRWYADGARDGREAAVLAAFGAAFAEAGSPGRVLDMLTLGLEGR